MCWGWTSYELERQINTVLLEVLMQGVVVVDRRGLTAVGATRHEKGEGVHDMYARKAASERIVYKI